MGVHEWIEKATAYFSGEMTPEEIQFFEKETAADKELNELMQLWLQTDMEGKLYEQNKKGASDFIQTHQDLKQYFTEEENESLPLSTVAADKQQDISSKQNKVRYLLRWVSAAAIIAGIIFFGKQLLAPSAQDEKTVANTQKTEPPAIHDTQQLVKKDTATSISSQELFAELFVPDAPPEDQRGAMDDAFFYYEMKKYKNAIAAIDDIPNKPLTRGNNNITAADSFYIPYYKALSFMALDNTKAALPLLQQCTQQTHDEATMQKVQWYAALAYLKENETGETLRILKSIMQSNTAGKYKSKAAVLYKKLNVK